MAKCQETPQSVGVVGDRRTKKAACEITGGFESGG
jgi:hypothetical protein